MILTLYLNKNGNFTPQTGMLLYINYTTTKLITKKKEVSFLKPFHKHGTHVMKNPVSRQPDDSDPRFALICAHRYITLLRMHPV